MQQNRLDRESPQKDKNTVLHKCNLCLLTFAANHGRTVAAPSLGIWGGHLRGNTYLGGGGDRISQPPPTLPKFLNPWIFFQDFQNLHFSRHNFFPDISNYFPDLPIQLRFSNNIWPFFTKVAPLPVWFLQPWPTTTNDFYRNYQELGEEQMEAENNFGGAFSLCCPPPPPAPPLWEKYSS